MRAFIFAAALIATSTAQAQHCYSIWHYKQPQHCGGAVRVAVARGSAWEETPLPLPRPVELREQPDIPLPDVVSPPERIPPGRDDMLRALGIESLKRQMGRSP
jgi:hypothetical protein